MKKRVLFPFLVFLVILIHGCSTEEISVPEVIPEEPEIVEEMPQPAVGEVKEIEEIERPEPASEPVVVEEMQKKDFGPVWNKRINDALAPSDCPEVPKPQYPASYYQGPLIDTHLHIPAIPDWDPEEDEEMTNEVPEGRFGGPEALLGWNVKMSQIACTITREGTHKNFAFFPVYEEIPEQLLEIWNRTMNKYPEHFIPFIMSSGNDNEPDGFPTVDAATLKKMLEVYPGLFDGYGEIGLYARENNGAPALPPDSKLLQGIYPVAKKFNLLVYFHPGENQLRNFRNILSQHPDITFIVHGDEIENDILGLMADYPNIYYTNDPSYSQHFDLYVGKSKEEFLAAVERDFDSLVAKDVKRWKKMIEMQPDRFMWGTDRGDASWNYDQDVGLFLVKYVRAFIGKLDPSVQEKFAYKNALKAVGKG